MGLFDKKYCDVCGEKIGVLGNRKLEDANLCKKCAAKLSPFMTDRRKTTLADIKEHLAYREANLTEVRSFTVNKAYGERQKLCIDESSAKFIVTQSGNWANENPDVISLSQVKACSSEIKEYKNEVKMKDKDGNMLSFNPPRYDIEYDFYLYIEVDSPWFNKISIKVNDKRVEAQNPVRYSEIDKLVSEMKVALKG